MKTLGLQRIVLAAGVLVVCGMAAATHASPPDFSEYALSSWECCTTPPDNAQIANEDGRVDDLCVIGNTIYIGGNFQKVRDPGGNVVDRTFLAAVDKDTGTVLRTFNPTLNDRVYSLAGSPDGATLYVGGKFDTANGQSHRGIVAFNVATGAVDPVLDGLDFEFSGGTVAPVKEITPASSGNDLYVGGGFVKVSGTSRTHLARLTFQSGHFVLNTT